MPLTEQQQSFLDNFGKPGADSTSPAGPSLSKDQQNYLDSFGTGAPSNSVFVPAVKRGLGQYLESLAAAGRAVGVDTQGINDYGKGLEEANPAQTPATLAGFMQSPWTAIKERTGEQLINTGTALAGATLGSLAGGVIAGPEGAVAGGAAGIAPEAAAAAAARLGIGKYIGGLVGGIATDYPNEVGQVVQQQEQQGVKDLPRALIGGAANAAIEMSPIGIEGALLKGLGGAGEKAAIDIAKETVGKYAAAKAAAEAAGEPFVKNVAPTVMKTIAGAAGKALSIAAGEAAEEVPQNEISRWSAHQDVLNKQSLQEDIDNASSAFAGSLFFGAAGGAHHQVEVNKATNSELGKLQATEDFNAQPPGTQTVIPGTNPEAEKAYVDWASNNPDTLGDKRVARYGLQSVLPKDASFTDVSDAIKVLESGAPITAIKAAPQAAAIDTQIADLTSKIADKQTKLQTALTDQQSQVAALTSALLNTPNSPDTRTQLEKATEKLAKTQTQIDSGPSASLTASLEKLTAQRDELAKKVQPLNLESATPQIMAQEAQRQKMLDKLHAARGDMAFFQDQAYAKTLDDHPEARDTLTRDLFAEQEAKDTSQQRQAEFDQAQAQVEQQKQAELDQVQAEAPPRTFSIAPPVEEQPKTAMQQAMEAAQAQQTANTQVAQISPVEPARTLAPIAPVTATPVATTPDTTDYTNAEKLQQVYADSGKTDTEAAALVRALTKNTDVNDTQAVSKLLADKANSNATQTRFEMLDKLHQAVTGVSLNDLNQGEQNAAPATNQAGEKAQAETPQTQSLGDKFNITSNQISTRIKEKIDKAFELQQKVEGQSLPDVLGVVAATSDNPASRIIARRVQAQISRLQKAGMNFSFNVAKEGTSLYDGLQRTGAIGETNLRADKNGSFTDVTIAGLEGMDHETLLHEGIHAGTQAAIELGKVAPEGSTLHNNYMALHNVLEVIYGRLWEHVTQNRESELPPVIQTWAARGNNVLDNEHELIAWTLSNKEVQDYMGTVPYNSKLSLWDKFVQAIADFFGISPKQNTALAEILRVSKNLLETNPEDLNAVAKDNRVKLYMKSKQLDQSAFNEAGHVTSDTELGRQLDSVVEAHPSLATNVKQFLTVGVGGTTSSVLGKGQRALEKNIQSPLHIASKSKGFSLTWNIVRQVPANAGYILNKAFATLEHTWVKGYNITAARALQFATGIENATFQDLRRAEMLLHDWNVSGLTREEYLAEPSTIAKFGEFANNSEWFSRVEEARAAIDYVLDAQFKQNAEDMRSVMQDDKEFTEWLDQANKTNEERKNTGYIPIRRYGNYSVAAYDMSKRTNAGFPSGDLGLMGKWFFHNELEAREFIKEFKSQYAAEPDVKLDSDFTHDRPQFIPKVKTSQYSYAPVSFRQFLEVAKRANVPIEAAEQQRLARLMINADSMYQNRIQRRKNVPGGSKDIVREMSEFITYIANRVASDRLAPRISEAMNITHPLAPEDVNQLSLLHSEFEWTQGKSEAQIRDDIHDQITQSGGTLADEVTQLARFNKMRELESNGFLAWRSSVNIDNPQEVAEFYDLMERREALTGDEEARFAQLSTPDPQAGFYHDKIAQHVEFLNEPKSEAFSNLRRFAAVNFLGASVSAAVVNLSSLPVNFMPYMHQYGGMSAYTSTMHWFSYALKNPMLRNTIFSNDTTALEAALAPEGKLPEGLSKEQAGALLRAFREEVVSDTQVFEYFAAAKHGVQIGTVLGQRAQALWMSPFRVSEMMNRVTSFMAAYDIGQKNLIDGKQLGAEELYQFARNAVDQTQFIYGPVNRPGISQNPVGFALMTFRGFSLMTIELMSRLPAKQRTIMLGTMIMASGVGGLPFKDDIADIIDTIGEKVFGAPVNTNRVLHNYFKMASEAITGTDLSRLMMTGPLDTLTGASLGSRLSLSNIIPATRIGTSGYSLADGMQDLGGVIASETKGLALGAGQLVQGNVGEAVNDAAPAALKNIMRFTEGVNTDKLTDRNGNMMADNLTLSELGLLAAGFTLSRSNWRFTQDQSVEQQQAFAKETTQSFFNHLAGAYQKGDYDTIAQDFEAIQQWNARYPQYSYKINPVTLRKELLNRSLPAGQRELQHIKKAWRGDVSDELLDEE